jgi:hypothetical protein
LAYPGTYRVLDVQKNVETVEKQLHTTQDKLNSILVISKPDIRNEEGLPMMEIREELDDEGNVICKWATELSIKEANNDPSIQCNDSK